MSSMPRRLTVQYTGKIMRAYDGKIPDAIQELNGKLAEADACQYPGLLELLIFVIDLLLPLARRRTAKDGLPDPEGRANRAVLALRDHVIYQFERRRPGQKPALPYRDAAGSLSWAVFKKSLCKALPKLM